MLTFIAGIVAAPAVWLIAISVVSLLLFTFAVLEKGFLTFALTLATGYLVAVRYPDLATNPTFIISMAGVYIAGGLLVGRFKWSRFLSNQFERVKNLRDEFLMSNHLPLDIFKQGIPAAAAIMLINEKKKPTNKNARNAFSPEVTVEKQTEEQKQAEQQRAEENLLTAYSDHLSRKIDYYHTPFPLTMETINAALAPKAKDNKGSIVMWIGYWPVYLVWYLIADICKDIGTAIYNAVGGHFQKMSDEKFNQL